MTLSWSITFALDGLSPEQYRAAAAEMAPTFATHPDIRLKLWLADEATSTYGGVYLFDRKADVERYLASDLFRNERRQSGLRRRVGPVVGRAGGADRPHDDRHPQPSLRGIRPDGRWMAGGADAAPPATRSGR